MHTRTLTKTIEMTSPRFIFAFLLWVTFASVLPGCVTTAARDSEPRDLPILQKWSGDYPVADLSRLPKGQEKAHVGFINNAATFTAVWDAFKLEENVPEVDFKESMIVYARNVEYYNRISISKVILRDGVVEIFAMETRSALPIEDKAAMAVAVIPRAGVKFLKTGNGQIPVSTNRQ